VSLDTFNDPNLAAVLIKKFLRDLPTPIFPERMYPLIQRCPIPSDEPGDVLTITYIRETILPELPKCSYILLSHILREHPSVCMFVWVGPNALLRIGP
jgi:Rho GTPase-activating protein 1